jgi:ATP-dependent RNA helicase DeaD
MTPESTIDGPTLVFDGLPASLGEALTRRGFTALTSVQEAVLAPALAGRDLRISSQTGSGKTVAIGMVLAPDLERAVAERAAAPVEEPSPEKRRIAAQPFALLLAPTRELAAQLGRELTWLLHALTIRVCTVTGGASVPAELRELRKNPLVVVATPGRLLDHLERGSIDPSRVGAVVLDEADQMLDLGFRDDLEAILGKMPIERRTHLVSATFSRDVLALADRYQQRAVKVEGTSLGEANEDIAHVAHLVRPGERDAALRNLLLMEAGERTLVFVRTRGGASDLADQLSAAGFSARALSGELEQWERTKTLDAFRSGAVSTLVATDVAARGLDVPDVGRVIHADPPGDADALTHRSGRTGRAGQKGTSVVLVPPVAREQVMRMYHRARIKAAWIPAPGPDDVLRAADERLRAELTAPPAPAAPDSSVEPQADPRLRALADKLLAEVDPTELITRLLARSRHTGPCAPLPVAPLMPPPPPAPRAPAPRRAPAERPAYGAKSRGARAAFAPESPDRPPTRARFEAPGTPPLSFVPFRINWGGNHGADPRRLLALVCRRGGVHSSQIGAIRVGDTDSTVEVASPAAPDFARSVKKPDARDPRIRIDPIEPLSENRPRKGGFAPPARRAAWGRG